MKKLLLFAGSLAVMVSCQKTETTPDAPQVPQSKGLVFAIEKGDNTKAEYQSDFYTNWNAETDRIGIFMKNAGLGVAATDLTTALANTTDDVWNHDGTNAMATANYKATTSGPRGYFAAVADVDVLLWGLNEEKPSEFAIFYPAPSATHVTTPTTGSATGKPEFKLPVLAAQTQLDANGASCVPYNVMVQMIDPIAASDLAVGEAIPMKLSRLYTVLPMKIKNSAAYGALKSITVAAEKSNIATSTTPGVYKFANVTKDAEGKYNYSKGMDLSAGTAVKSVKLTVNAAANTETIDGINTWSEDATAYVTVLPVARKSVSEKMTATYEFANATFTQEWNVSADWTPNMFVASTPVLDCATAPVFFGTVPSSTDKALYINEAFGAKSIKSLIQANGTDVKVGATTEAISGIKAIYSTNTQLDIDGLEKFTAVENLKLANTTLASAQLSPLVALKKVTLANATAIPAKSFAASSLTHLTAPAVITIANDALPTGTLTDVVLSAYKYASATVNAKIFSIALNLVDMSNVNTVDENMAVSMAGATTLEVVMVKNGVELSEGTFKGFQALLDVVLPYDPLNEPTELEVATVKLMGESVFEGAEKLDAIGISNTEVPANSFKDCALLEVALFVTAPTKIGASAFEGAEVLVDIDLSAATEIGKAAFKDCAALVGKEDPILKRNVLNVDKLEVLNNDVFNGCADLKYVTFNSVTKVGNTFLTGVSPEVLIFGTPFTFDTTVAGVTATTKMTALSFGTNTNTALTVNVGQEGLQTGGLKVKVGGTDFTFKSISTK